MIIKTTAKGPAAMRPPVRRGGASWPRGPFAWDDGRRNFPAVVPACRRESEPNRQVTNASLSVSVRFRKGGNRHGDGNFGHCDSRCSV